MLWLSDLALISKSFGQFNKKKWKEDVKQETSIRNETQPAAHLVTLTLGHPLAGVKSPYHEESWSIMHSCEDVRDATQRHLLISHASSCFHPGDMPCYCGVCVCVVGWVQYLHTYHHVLFISHLDVSIYPVPQRKSTLIKQESTQDHTTSVQLCLHPVRGWLHFEYNEHSANYDSIVLIQWKH